MAGIQIDGANQKLVLDSDADTYLEAATDDTIKFYVAGAHDLTVSANAINVLSGTTLTIDSGATITNSGTSSGFGAITAVNSATANELVTIGATTTELDAESGLTYTDGSLVIGGTTPSLTIGDAGAEDTKIVFDGNAQDFYIALDDSADDLLIGLGSTVGTTPAISIDENLAIKTYGDITMTGTTPVLTIGDAGAEDTAIVFDGNAQDYYIALDDSADDLLIGLGSTVGTTPAIAIDENLKVTTYGDIVMTGTTPTLTIGDAGAEDTTIVFDGNAQDFYIALDDSADDLVIGLGSTVGTTPIISLDEDKVITFAAGTSVVNSGTWSPYTVSTGKAMVLGL